MWKAIQDFFGPVPIPIFGLLFLSGLVLALIATAPTQWVDRGHRAFQRWLEKRRAQR
jgi:hypothetical protein